jgi:hypothetical protein
MSCRLPRTPPCKQMPVGLRKWMARRLRWTPPCKQTPGVASIEHRSPVSSRLSWRRGGPRVDHRHARRGLVRAPRRRAIGLRAAVGPARGDAAQSEGPRALRGPLAVPARRVLQACGGRSANDDRDRWPFARRGGGVRGDRAVARRAPGGVLHDGAHWSEPRPLRARSIASSGPAMRSARDASTSSPHPSARRWAIGSPGSSAGSRCASRWVTGTTRAGCGSCFGSLRPTGP